MTGFLLRLNRSHRNLAVPGNGGPVGDGGYLSLNLPSGSVRRSSGSKQTQFVVRRDRNGLVESGKARFFRLSRGVGSRLLVTLLISNKGFLYLNDLY